MHTQSIEFQRKTDFRAATYYYSYVITVEFGQ